MNSKIIKCLCGNNFKEKQLNSHIKVCQLFLKKFTIFDYKISSLLQNYLSDKENIYLVKFLFKRYIYLINRKIKRIQIDKNVKEGEITKNTNEIIINETSQQKIEQNINEEKNDINFYVPNNFIKNENSDINKDKENNIKLKITNINNGISKLMALFSSDEIRKSNFDFDINKLENSNLNKKENAFKNYQIFEGRQFDINNIIICPLKFKNDKPKYDIIINTSKEIILRENREKCSQYCQRYYKLFEKRVLYEKYINYKNPFTKLIFIFCNKCNQLYYAGKLRNKLNKELKQIFFENNEYCICGKDSIIPDAKGDSFCVKHGNKYIEYKCKYCCKISSRFYSKTHLCEDCYFKEKNLNEIPKAEKCSLKTCEFFGNHSINGSEYSLGCFECKLENIHNKKNESHLP